MSELMESEGCPPRESSSAPAAGAAAEAPAGQAQAARSSLRRGSCGTRPLRGLRQSSLTAAPSLLTACESPAGASAAAPAAGDQPPLHPDHENAQAHHHHTHAASSQHVQGHHLLQVSGLSVGFRMYDPSASYLMAEQRVSNVIEDLSISVHEGEIVAAVGASGSGKTLLADCVMGLYEPNATVKGEVWFDGQLMSPDELAAVRGRAGGIALVPQSVSHLDPLMRVGAQVEGACARAERPARAARRRELFSRYGLDESVARMYPFELSGGMARRVLLCCVLMGAPKLIVADEPTPGLDLDLAVKALADFRSFADEGGGVMLITHDIELALRVADRVAVFKDGTIVEETAVANFASPELLAHPFSKALWHALPEHGFAAGMANEGGRAC